MGDVYYLCKIQRNFEQEYNERIDNNNYIYEIIKSNSLFSILKISDKESEYHFTIRFFEPVWSITIGNISVYVIKNDNNEVINKYNTYCHCGHDFFFDIEKLYDFFQKTNKNQLSKIKVD